MVKERIVDLGTRLIRVVSFTLRLSNHQGKGLRYPLNKRMGGPQNRHGHREEKNLSEIEPRFHGHPVSNNVIIRTMTALYQAVKDLQMRRYNHGLRSAFKNVSSFGTVRKHVS
jgi:hypothetical protein